ncbi:hypothetical protein MD484_g7050, partial [Candolleomyces efflorescens]
MRQIVQRTSERYFRKPAEKYTPLLIFGPNIVASEGEQWKKYKKIVGPAFSEANNKLIWSTSVKVMLDLFDDVWGEQQTIDVGHGADLTLAITLLVLGSGVFGMETSWKDRTTPAPGHTLGFQECLRIVSMNLKTRVVLPKWAYYLSKKLKLIDVAFTEMEQYIREMIQERSSSTTQKSYDLLSSLIEHNKQEEEASSLNDRELIGEFWPTVPDHSGLLSQWKGNIFMIMSAGHETSAHTLCFALALLAMYPDEQTALYEHVKSVLPETGVPDYSCLPRLTRCHAVLNETLRMFPPVGGIPKICTQTIWVITHNQKGKEVLFPVRKGEMLSFVPPALHYNPKYWPDPYAFKPERFMPGDWPRDAFVPFSLGPHACLGRRFFETEATAILALLISRYKVSIKEEPQFAGESFEQKKERIFTTKHLLSLT